MKLSIDTKKDLKNILKNLTKLSLKIIQSNYEIIAAVIGMGVGKNIWKP